MKKLLIYPLLMFSLSSLVYGTNLMDIYHQALDNDPTFKEAYSKYLSNSEAIPQACAALYPQLSINAQINRNFQNSITSASVSSEDPYVSSATLATKVIASYNSTQWQVNASQAVFNAQLWAKVKQAKSSVKAAYASFNDAAQELILRTTKAYFDILLAKDTVNFAKAKKRANQRQLKQAEERLKVGLDTITSVYEAKAAYDQSVAEVISAENNQINQNENLRKLTNHIYDNLAPLKTSYIPLIKPNPNNVDVWINTGLRQNYNLHAARFSLEAARNDIKVQASGRLPTLSIQGNTNQIRNDVGNGAAFAPNRQTLSTITLAMNFPAFQGGLVQSQVRQAQFDYQVSSEQLEKTYRDVVVNSRITFNNITDGISKVIADRQTVISRINSLESTEAQFKVGTRTMVDVVNAQQRLFEAQRELANDQYNLINALLTLKYLAGTLNANDIKEINSWLAITQVRKTSPSITPKKVSH